MSDHINVELEGECASVSIGGSFSSQLLMLSSAATAVQSRTDLDDEAFMLLFAAAFMASKRICDKTIAVDMKDLLKIIKGENE